MLIIVVGFYEFARRETNDNFVAFMIGLFILFNFGFTFLLTTLEDNIWMYGPLILFIYFLYQERWAISALFLSVAILMHIQCEVFIPWILIYMGYKLNFSVISENIGAIKRINIEFSNIQIRKFIIALIFLLMPLLAAYSYLFLLRGWKLNNFIDSFLASDSAYHGDTDLWFFAANRTIDEQLKYAYYGYISTFVCHFPEFLTSMPRAIYLGGILVILISYILFMSLSFNLKTICAIPTFIILFFHAMIFESWSTERWDFFPFFISYFLAVGYNVKGDKVKKSIRIVFALLVIFLFTFTFASFNSLCGFQESPLCAYGDKLGTLFDNQSIALETMLSPDGLRGGYLRYQSNDSILFANPGNGSINNYTNMKIYTSNLSFKSISDIFPGVQWDSRLIWPNEINKSWSIIQIKPKIILNIIGGNSGYSKRTEGNRVITVYQSLDNKIKCAVFKNTQPEDLSENGLLKEILWAEPESDAAKIDGKPSVYLIDGHNAMSMKTIQVDPSSGLRTNNRPDHYFTAISYPEKYVILTIACNGDNVTWDTEKQIVNMLKL